MYEENESFLATIIQVALLCQAKQCVTVVSSFFPSPSPSFPWFQGVLKFGLHFKNYLYLKLDNLVQNHAMHCLLFKTISKIARIKLISYILLMKAALLPFSCLLFSVPNLP